MFLTIEFLAAAQIEQCHPDHFDDKVRNGDVNDVESRDWLDLEQVQNWFRERIRTSIKLDPPDNVSRWRLYGN